VKSICVVRVLGGYLRHLHHHCLRVGQSQLHHRCLYEGQSRHHRWIVEQVRERRDVIQLLCRG
jgi:hypothetical protein